MRRPPLSMVLTTISGIILAILLIGDGLFMRIFSEARDSSVLWARLSTRLGIPHTSLAWPWMVLGISWIGALLGMWLRLSWGRKAVLICAALSMSYVLNGSILAGIALLMMSMASSRNWLKEGNAKESD